MISEGASFNEVLAQTQALGYAETDPSFDVQGTDTAHKLAIVIALATGAWSRLEDIPIEGICELTLLLDIQFVGEFGFTINLLACMAQNGGKV